MQEVGGVHCDRKLIKHQACIIIHTSAIHRTYLKRCVLETQVLATGVHRKCTLIKHPSTPTFQLIKHTPHIAAHMLVLHHTYQGDARLRQVLILASQHLCHTLVQWHPSCAGRPLHAVALVYGRLEGAAFQLGHVTLLQQLFSVHMCGKDEN